MALTGKAIGQELAWWAKERDIADIVRTEELLPIFKQFAIMCAVRLGQRLLDPDTPADVKDKIALAFAPRVTAELRGKLGSGGDASAVDELMGAYKIG